MTDVPGTWQEIPAADLAGPWVVESEGELLGMVAPSPGRTFAVLLATAQELFAGGQDD